MAGLEQYSEFFANPLFTETIREVPVEASYIGPRFLPAEETYDLDWNETVVTHQADMAPLVDSMAELPFTDRDPVSRVSGSIADIGQSYVVTKKELQGLLDKGNPGKRKLTEKILLGKSAQCKKNVDARIEWLRWQALGEGVMTYNQNGIILSVDFGVPADSKKTAATKWDGVTPAIMTDYEGWVQAYVDLNGEPPDAYVTSIKVIRAVLNDATVRKQVTGLADKLITLAELNTFLRDRQLPPMEAFDSQVTYRNPATGARTTARLLNQKKGVFLQSGGAIGNAMIGPTVENKMEPGVFARSFQMERPQRQLVEVVAASFPKIIAPKLIYITTVLT